MSVRLAAAPETRVPPHAIVPLPDSYAVDADGHRRHRLRAGFLVASPWGHLCHWFSPLQPGGPIECACQLPWYLLTREPWHERITSVLEPRRRRG